MTDYKVLLDVECPSCHKRLQLALGSGEDEPPTTVDNRKRLTEALTRYSQQLNVTREGSQVIIKAKKLLDRAVWNEINSLVKASGGSWIAEGANSKWVLRDG